VLAPINTSVYSWPCASLHPHPHPYLHTPAPTYTPTYTPTHLHTYTRIHEHTMIIVHTHTHTLTHLHTHIHTYTHSRTLTQSHTLAHLNTRHARMMCTVRCLLITESPKTPSHYRYQIKVLGYIPYTGLAVFSLRFLVFLCILRFRIFQVRVLNASE